MSTHDHNSFQILTSLFMNIFKYYLHTLLKFIFNTNTNIGKILKKNILEEKS